MPGQPAQRPGRAQPLQRGPIQLRPISQILHIAEGRGGACVEQTLGSVLAEAADGAQAEAQSGTRARGHEGMRARERQ